MIIPNQTQLTQKVNLYIHNNNKKYIKYQLNNFSINKNINNVFQTYGGQHYSTPHREEYQLNNFSINKNINNVFQTYGGQHYSTPHREEYEITLNVAATSNIYDELSEFSNILIEVDDVIYLANYVRMNNWSVEYDHLSSLEISLTTQLLEVIRFDDIPNNYMFMFKNRLRKKKMKRIIS